MSDMLKLYIYIISGLLIGCMCIGLCYATYYIINDKELLFKIIAEMKIIVIGIGFYWLIAKFMSKFWEK